MFERIFFVVAPNFHGSTLLGKLLNDHPDVVSLGDTYPRNDITQVCGCGETVTRCPFWQTIASKVKVDRYHAYPHWLPDYPQIIGGSWDRVFYNGLSPYCLGELIRSEKKVEFREDFLRFADSVHLYEGNEQATVFVDGVKSISRVLALSASGVRVDGVIHVQRNPGDYINSTAKREQVSRVQWAKTLLQYRFFHNRARRLAAFFPYISVTYEGIGDFPDETVRELFRFIGVSPLSTAELAEVSEGKPWHFMGNASLFHFDGRIRVSRHPERKSGRGITRALAGAYRERERHLKIASSPKAK